MKALITYHSKGFMANVKVFANRQAKIYIAPEFPFEKGA
jgi:hypothetical protein